MSWLGGNRMKMTSIKMKKILEERLSNPDYRTSYNRDKDTFRIEWKESKKGMTVTLPNVIAKYNQRGDAALDDLEGHITEALKIMNEEHHLTGMEKQIYRSEERRVGKEEKVWR